MKNLLNDFFSLKFRGNGKTFLYYQEQSKEIVSSNKIEEIKKVTELTEAQIDPLRKRVELTAELNNNNKPQLSTVPPDPQIKRIPPTQERYNSPRNYEVTQNKEALTTKEIENFAKEKVKEFALQDEEFTQRINREYSSLDELKQALAGYPPVESREKFLKFLRTKATTDHKWTSHLTAEELIPDKKDLGDYGKIFTALFSLGFISNEGGFKESFVRGAKWGLVAAAVSFPAVSNSLAHFLRWSGKTAYNVASYPISLLVDFIYEPGKTVSEIQQGQFPGTNEKIAEMALVTSDAYSLMQKGVKFSPQLENLATLLHNYKKDKKQVTLKNLAKASAKFYVQSTDLRLSSEEFERLRKQAFKKEDISVENRRKMILTDLFYDIDELLNDKDNSEFREIFEAEKIIQEQNLESPSSTDLKNAKNKLKKYSTEDLKNMIGVGQDFSKLSKISREKSHGIGRALDNMAGTSLLTYILIFFLMKGVMGIKGLVNPENWKKEKLKEKAGKAKKILFFVPNMLWKGASYPFRAINKMRWRKKIGKIGQNLKQGAWNADQVKLWENLPKKEKNKAVRALFEKVKKNKEALEKRKKEIKKNFKGKERKEELKKAISEAETSAKEFSAESWEELFKDVKTKDGKSFLEALSSPDGDSQ